MSEKKGGRIQFILSPESIVDQIILTYLSRKMKRDRVPFIKRVLVSTIVIELRQRYNNPNLSEEDAYNILISGEEPHQQPNRFETTPQQKPKILEENYEQNNDDDDDFDISDI